MHRRQWSLARDAFGEAVAADERVATAWEGLAYAAMCVDDFDLCRTALERAYVEGQRADDCRTAARAAMQLAVHHASFRGQSAIASGWFERARTLLATCAPAAEHAWLALWEAHVAIHVRGELTEGQRKLEEAVRIDQACQVGGELSLLTRGLLGLTAIGDGAIREGLRRLDEVTTAALTELPSPMAVGWTCCYVLDACERVRDFDRALQWVERAFTAGRELAIPHFAGFCRTHYISVLLWRGDYAGAEREADRSRREVGALAPAYAAQCDIRVGEIRRRQGRLDAAAALLETHAAHPQAMLSLAALALDRDQPQRALDLAERYLRRVPKNDRIRRLHGLEPLIRSLLRLRRCEAAREALAEARHATRDATAPLMPATVDELEGLEAGAHEDFDAARRHLEDAVDAYDLNALPYEAASARLELASVLARLGRNASAYTALRAARDGAKRLSAQLLFERATRALAPSSPAPAAKPPHGLSAREVDVLRLLAEGASNHEIGDRLCISAFTVKRHVTNILTKLDLPTRAAAAAYAIREGLLQ
jgi:DNA-binding CsgD family transcriptional regulator